MRSRAISILARAAACVVAAMLSYVSEVRADGEIDSGFDPVVGGTVLTTAVQPDGSVLLGGSITTVDGVLRNGIARVDSQGNLDLTFNPYVGGTVYTILVQPDGKIVIGGTFTSVEGVYRGLIARLLTSGALDESFNPGADGVVHCFAALPNGQILMAGSFGSVGGIARNRIARLNADGTLDTEFSPPPSYEINGTVRCLAVLPDGNLLIGGDFVYQSQVYGNKIRLARLYANGSLNGSWTFNMNNSVRCIAVQPDGGFLAGGAFTTAGGTTRNYLARFTAAGSLDLSYSPSFSHSVHCISLQSNGTALVGGAFTMINGTPRSYVARLTTAGAVDIAFNPNANGALQSIGIQANGAVLLAGDFTTVSGSPRPRAARVLNPDPVTTFSVPDREHIVWTPGATAPQVAHVLFGLSTDSGATWSPLGFGIRVGTTSNWTLGNLGLPQSGWIRAMGRTSDGRGAAGLPTYVESFSAADVPDIAVAAPGNVQLADGGPQQILWTSGVGDTVALTFTVRNVGFVALTGLSFSVEGAAKDSFDLVLPEPTTLAPGESAAVTVTFTQAVATYEEATLVVRSHDPDEDPFEIPLSGRINAPPVLYLPGSPLIVEADFDSGSYVPFAVTAFDAEDGVRYPVVSHASGSLFPIGDTTVHASVTDSQGVATMGSFVVRVQDTTAPHMNLLGANPLIAFQGEPFHEPGAFSWDSISGVGEIQVTSELDVNVPGSYTLTYVAVDQAGNSTSLSRIVNVVPPSSTGVQAGFDAQVGDVAWEWSVRVIAVQPDGKILLGGNFLEIDGILRRSIARLNADGSLDEAFNASLSGESAMVSSISVQADGKILVGGGFSTVDGVPRALARLHADGTLDTAFDPEIEGGVSCMVLQADGKILVGSNLLGSSSVVRLNHDGTVDEDFVALLQENGSVGALAIESDGGILVGGGGYGSSPPFLLRLRSDGYPEYIDDSNILAPVRAISIQADGKILVGIGVFSFGSPPTTDSALVRLHPDGTQDAEFVAKVAGDSSWVDTIAIQVDGKILIGGGFSTVNGANQKLLARLNPDGSLDTDIELDTDSYVGAVALQGDGKILVGGVFSTMNSVSRRGIARLHNDPADATLSVPDLSVIAWDRSGSSAEVSRTQFELSIDNGVSWSFLGHGVRMGTTSNWSISGLNLPPSAIVRARAWTNDGGHGSSLIEQTVTYEIPTPEIAIEYPSGTELEDGDTVQLGTVATGDGIARKFVIRNVGTAELTEIAASFDGGETGDFPPAIVPVDNLPPGGSTTVTIRFEPAGTGMRSTWLRVASSDTSEDPFDIELEGMGVSAAEMFEQAASEAGLAGTGALPEGIPHADGIKNLLKYAFNMDLADPGVGHVVPAIGTSGLPHISWTTYGDTCVLRFEYIRREGSGLSYVPRKSATLGTWDELVSTPVVNSIDNGWERVVIEEPIDLNLSPSWFGKVDVTGDF